MINRFGEKLKLYFFICVVISIFSIFSTQAMAGTKVQFQTSKGDLVIELEDEKAPNTVKNFLHYVNSGFYDGVMFHRVIPGFVVQGGGFLPGFSKPDVKGLPPIKNEADNGLKNTRYSLSMARTADPDSATSQFFINLNDNAFLDHTAKSQEGWGYAVFGRVVEGQKVVDSLGSVKTGPKAPHSDVPLTDIVIISAKQL